MRKIEEQMNMAIRARKSWAGSNTTVRAYNESIDVYLHGHCIAWLDVINECLDSQFLRVGDKHN